MVVVEDSSLLACDAMSLGQQQPIFTMASTNQM